MSPMAEGEAAASGAIRGGYRSGRFREQAGHIDHSLSYVAATAWRSTCRLIPKSAAQALYIDPTRPLCVAFSMRVVRQAPWVVLRHGARVRSEMPTIRQLSPTPLPLAIRLSTARHLASLSGIVVISAPRVPTRFARAYRPQPRRSARRTPSSACPFPTSARQGPCRQTRRRHRRQ